MNDSPPSNEPRQRLIEAAIAQIEATGLAGATVRNISTRAGMNIASVNYYFGSKDALLDAALVGSIEHMVSDASQILDGRPEIGLEATLVELFVYLLEGASRYPRLMRAHLEPAFAREDYSGPFPVLFDRIIIRLRDEVLLARLTLEEDSASRRVIAALSAILFPSLFGGLFGSLDALQVGGSRAAYAERVARSLLQA
ncbi:MAG: TetR/AcrR family transcriptional regulator [Myxococcales bacterium]|nr:TetR/AcrR family transcriptional regulator [Myxococcales bacterium]